MPDTIDCTVTVAGTGSYVPEKILTNDDIAKMVDTSDEWIRSRTGIRERRIAADDQATSDLGYRAALAAMEDAGVTAEEIDLIVVATVSPDMFFPSTACFIQKKLGAKNAVCFDVSAACSGFLYAMQICRHFINGGNRKTALVIGAEKLSTMTNWEDRNTCVLFGDGAGAVVLKENPNATRRIISSSLASDGNQTDILTVPGGGSACPITTENAHLNLNAIAMQGREVYKHAVNAMRRAAEDALEKAGYTAADLDMIIPHQANLRIIEAVTDRLGVSKEKTFINLEKYGNTSAAAVAIALDEANKTGAIKSGDLVLMVAFGSGLTWASTLLRW
ncbi:MAG: 3-oxoacyl-[acyl-carrier-protein] synthase-3 [Verrucomicrobiales bacterium]|jgi:3-oxoacyl-[acyl-carrier-protein] synthase-3